MALIDPDRFEGKPRKGAKALDAQGLMRRMVKEELLTFEGKPLFPERRAYTVTYPLSPQEALLYDEVTEYVREEMNRADRLKAEGEGRRGNVVGFALTVLQRRLASSPEAIYQSLRRRRERLEARLNEERLGRRGREEAIDLTVGLEAPEDIDDLPDGELEDLEEEVVDQASAAKTIAELEVRDRDACAASSSSPSRCAAPAPTRSGRASRSCCRTPRRRCSTRPASAGS